jgi:[acyl-carrier-protein] S-malonyltransferase
MREAMQEAVPVGKGAMLAILGINLEEINKYISILEKDSICEIANDNAEGQIIASGNTNSIIELQIKLKENNKKSIILPVSAPFHCSLMKPAAEKMNSKINEINFKNSKVEIITNVNATPESENKNFKKLLVEQIYSKVKWRESILYMVNKGVSEFIEIGPGKVLNGLVKRITKNSISRSINTLEDINKFKK